MKSIISVENITYKLDDGSTVLSELNLQVDEGERVGVVGPNGKGKTTLFLLMAGIYKPSLGRISLFDKDVVPGKFNSKLGMVFQNQDDQLFASSVALDIAFGPINMGMSAVEVDAAVKDVLSRLNIEHLKDKPPHHLSGGEKRLVAIAGMLAMHPQLMIWDEPSSNLDMSYRRRLIELIKENDDTEAMLIASHDLELILEVCTRVILLDEGTIIAEGTPDELLQREDLLLQHGLEVPFSLKNQA